MAKNSEVRNVNVIGAQEVVVMMAQSIIARYTEYMTEMQRTFVEIFSSKRPPEELGKLYQELIEPKKQKIQEMIRDLEISIGDFLVKYPSLNTKIKGN